MNYTTRKTASSYYDSKEGESFTQLGHLMFVFETELGNLGITVESGDITAFYKEGEGISMHKSSPDSHLKPAILAGKTWWKPNVIFGGWEVVTEKEWAIIEQCKKIVSEKTRPVLRAGSRYVRYEEVK